MVCLTGVSGACNWRSQVLLLPYCILYGFAPSRTGAPPRVILFPLVDLCPRARRMNQALLKLNPCSGKRSPPAPTSLSKYYYCVWSFQVSSLRLALELREARKEEKQKTKNCTGESTTIWTVKESSGKRQNGIKRQKNIWGKDRTAQNGKRTLRKKRKR